MTRPLPTPRTRSAQPRDEPPTAGRRLRGGPAALLATAVLVVIACVLVTLVIVPLGAHGATGTLPWPAFVVAFGLAELAAIRIVVRNQVIAISLAEIPLAVGFYFVAPSILVGTLVVGTGLVLAFFRRMHPVRLAFVMAILAIAGSLAVLAFHASMELIPNTLAGLFLASFAGSAVSVAFCAGVALLLVALHFSRPQAAALRQSLPFGLLAAFLNSSIAAVAVVFIRNEPDAAWLLAAPAAVGLIGYRAFRNQREQQARIEFLHESRRILTTGRIDEAGLGRLLQRLADLLGARTVDIILDEGAERASSQRMLVDAARRVRREPATAKLARARRELLPSDGTGQLLAEAPAGEAVTPSAAEPSDPFAPPSDGDAGAPGAEGAHDAMLVPVSGATGVLGTLLVAGDLDERRAFGPDDLRVLETLGSRIGLAAEHSDLVAQLAASQADVTQLAALVESSEDAIIAVAANGLTTAWNPAAERLIGRLADTMLGHDPTDGLPARDAHRLRASFATALEGTVVRSIRMRWARADDTSIPVSITISPIIGSHGRIVGASAIIRDESDRVRAEDVAAARAEQLRTVIAGSPLGMGLAGLDHLWTEANPALCAMLGFAPGEAVGRPVTELIHPEDLATVRRLEDKIFEGEAVVRSIERRYQTRDGRVTWTSVTARLLQVPSFETPVALYMIEDITERRQAEEQARTMEERFRRAALAISAVQDPAEVPSAVLRSARETFRAEFAAMATFSNNGADLTRLEVDGVDLAMTRDRVGRWMLGKGVLAAVTRMGRPLRLRNVKDHPEFGGFPGGHPVFSSMLAVPVNHDLPGRTILIIGNKLDADEFSEGDEAIAVALATHAGVCLENARVNARARALVEELDRANSDLMEASEAKTRFLANVAHELRAPLHAILVAGELVHDPPGGPLGTEAVRDLGAKIASSGRHMVRLIDDLVDLSRIEAGKLDLRPLPVSATSILAEVAASLAGTAVERGIALELPDGADHPVVADPVRLRQILTNLVANALKFTERGGRVWVEITPGDDGTRITVRDTGIGIAPEDVERAFLPFEQVSRTSTPGAGLGLAISRSLAELHGGTLEANSAPGVGSAFTLFLPAQEPRAPRIVPEAPAAPSVAGVGGGRPILVVEDDVTAIELVTAVLRMADYDVWQATSLADATERLAAATPALILLDIRLGDGNGLELIRRVRADRERAALPILVLSADAMPDDQRRAREAGCSDFLAKPISPRTLLARIERLLEQVDRVAAGG